MRNKEKNIELSKKILDMEALQSIELDIKDRTRARLTAMILSDALDRKYALTTLESKNRVIVTRHW